MHPETMGQPTQKLETSNEVTKVLYKERELEWISTFKNRIFCQHTFKTEDEEGFFYKSHVIKREAVGNILQMAIYPKGCSHDK